jgi:hypothetical protein
MNIASRLAKLEAKTNGSVIVVWRHFGETNERQRHDGVPSTRARI